MLSTSTYPKLHPLPPSHFTPSINYPAPPHCSYGSSFHPPLPSHVYPSMGPPPHGLPLQPPAIGGYHHLGHTPSPRMYSTYDSRPIHPASNAQLAKEETASQHATYPLGADRAEMTYHGHIKTSTDAILLLAACDLPRTASTMSDRDAPSSASPPPRRISRRLLEQERADLIRTGSVFVWDEAEAGMRRWTDGRCWSASRVSGCFLTYRELEVRKRSAHDSQGPKANQYKIDGLIKQSFSMTTASGRKLHIVSYYTKRDLREGRLRRVSEDPRFVGEAGGEWGLEVDEVEFPDPVLNGNEQAAGAHAQAGVSPAHQQPQQAGATVNTASAAPHRRPSGDQCDSILSKDDVPSSPRSLHSVPRPEQRKGTGILDAQENASCIPRAFFPDHGLNHGLKRPRSPQDPLPQPMVRPPLKRMRSSSAGELLITKPILSPPLGECTTLRPCDVASRRQSDAPNMLTLTESNIRGAGLVDTRLRGFRPMLTPGGRNDDSHASRTPSTEAEQDSAAGVLLSLRGSQGGSFLFPGGSSTTPLTTPEDGTTPPERASSGKSSSQQATPPTGTSTRCIAPARSASDKNALNKLSLRL